MTPAARVHKHRTKLRTQHCRRLEVTLAVGLIDWVHALAKAKKVPTWKVVQTALLIYSGKKPFTGPALLQ